MTTATIAPTRQAEFWAGFRDTFPLVVGASPFAVIFGALAVSSQGTSTALAMSAFVFAGSAQFIAITLMTAGASSAVIILTTFVVNLRHALYSATLGPHVKHLPQRWLIPLGFWLTDESFVIVVSRYNRADDSPYKHWYFLGSEIFMYTNWVFWTCVGAIAGERIKNPQNWGLDFALIVTFIGMVIPYLKNRPMQLAVLVAAISAVLTNGLPNKLGLVITSLLGILAGYLAELYWPEETES